MNRVSRHELAERDLRSRLAKDGQVVVRASTTSPCDVISLHGKTGRPTCWEVKTSKGRLLSDLSPDERTFAKAVEAIGVPFVLARFEVAGARVVGSPDLSRPFQVSK